MKIAFAILVLIALAARAQTNEPIVQVKFYSDPNATNQITFLEKGSIQNIKGVVDGTFPQSGRILVSTMLPSKNENGFPIFDENGYWKWEKSGNQIVLANYPALEVLTTGGTIDFAARKIGTIRGLKSDGTDSSRVLELWEYVDARAEAQLKAKEDERLAEIKKQENLKKMEAAEKIGLAKALKYNQDLADKGDAYGELRMGERYLKGDGVETNRTLAIEWLQKSAAQGNSNASNVLSEINFSPTNAVNLESKIELK